MDFFQNQSDILLSYDTDIDFQFDDLLITSGLDMIKRQVFKHLISELNDWKISPEIGASPNNFTGERNSRETGQLLKQFIESRIQQHIDPAVLNVKVVPINYDNVKIYIDINVSGNITSLQPLTLDYINGIKYTQFDEVVDTLVSNSITKMNDINSINNPNPYVDRLSVQAKNPYLRNL